MLQINNLIGFGGGGLAVALIDDGDDAVPDTNSFGVLTWTSETSTGPDTLVLLTWENSGATRTLDTMTFDGNAMDILVQDVIATGNRPGAAICIISGAQSGNIVATMSGTTTEGGITIISASNLRSLAAQDTDSNTGTGSDITLTALVSTGNKGVAIAVHVNDGNATPITWTNATEIADFSLGGASSRHSAAWVIGAPAGNIKADGATDDQTIVGVTLR